jgi:hypothetical protein
MDRFTDRDIELIKESLIARKSIPNGMIYEIDQYEKDGWSSSVLQARKEGLLKQREECRKTVEEIDSVLKKFE